VDGKITAWGDEKNLDTEGATTEVDANGVTLAPGLIDSHIHPVIGDYTPRQQQLHWIDSTLHGGVTTLISAGEVHMPGRPKDIVGLKAMAIAAQRWYENFRPSGVKVHAGAPVMERLQKKWLAGHVNTVFKAPFTRAARLFQAPD